MRTIRLPFLTAVLCASFGLLFESTANAQAYKVKASEPKFEELKSPEFNATSVRKSFKANEWLEVEAPFEVKMAPEPPSKTAERVLVKWYVAVEHPDRKGAYLLLTKDITHVNVPLNQEIFSSVYLSPGSVMRLTGGDRASKSIVYLVGYEVLINGEKVGEATSGSKVGWWNVASKNISRSDTVPLLSKDETAFAHMWWDRYAEILQEKR
jgi:hypothetical protein